MVLSLCEVPVLSGSPFEDSKKSDVSEVAVLSCVLEEAEVSVVWEVSVVLLVSVVALDEEDEEESEPVGLFLPQPAISRTAQNKAADKIRAKSFFIIYIISFQKLTVKILPRNKSFSVLLFLYVWKICAFYF